MTAINKPAILSTLGSTPIITYGSTFQSTHTPILSDKVPWSGTLHNPDRHSFITNVDRLTRPTSTELSDLDEELEL